MVDRFLTPGRPLKAPRFFVVLLASWATVTVVGQVDVYSSEVQGTVRVADRQ